LSSFVFRFFGGTSLTSLEISSSTLDTSDSPISYRRHFIKMIMRLIPRYYIHLGILEQIDCEFVSGNLIFI
jgi:hypothetical protein